MSLFRRCLPLASARRSFSTTYISYSGHNKWSKIKQKKGVNDIKKGAVYTAAAREIVLAVRTGGSADPDLNASLSAVLKKAKTQGVPKDNIENALKRGAGLKGKGGAEQLTYELMGPASVGIIVESLSDNPNRALKSLRNIMKDYNARLANVAYLFQRKGRVRIALDKADEAKAEQVIEAALEVEAEDFEQSEGDDGIEIEFLCPPTSLSKLIEAVTAPGMSRELISSELIFAPMEPSEPPEDEELQNQLANLVDALEADDDVLKVWTTLDD